jgi:hypothetical protein
MNTFAKQLFAAETMHTQHGFEFRTKLTEQHLRQVLSQENGEEYRP